MAGSNSRRPGLMSVRGVMRTKRVVERVESMSIGGGPRPGNRSTPWTYGVVRAKVTTAVPTGSWDSPSSAGRAQIYHKDSTGAWVASGDPVELWNDFTLTASIPVGRVVRIGWIGGEWWLVSGSCS